MTDARIKLTALDQTQAAFASVSRNFDALQGKLGGLGLALPVLSVGASAGALAALTLEASKAIDEFNDLKDATGASIENISALDRVARENGDSFDLVATSLIKFNKILNDSGTDGSRAAEILKSLGLNAAELKKQDPAEAMRQLAVAFATFADDGAKGRAILELTSKSAREMAHFLQDLSEQTELNGKTSTAAADEAQKFNKQLYALKANAEDAARYLSNDLVRGINAAAKAYRESGFWNGLGTLLLGDEEHRNNVEFSGAVDRLLAKQNALDAMRSKGAPEDNVNVQTLKVQIAETQALIDKHMKLRQVKDTSSDPAGKPSLNVPDAKKSGGGGAKKDPLAEAKRYLENLQKQLEKTQGLSIEEQTLLDIQKKRIEFVNPAIEKELLATARLSDLKKAETDNLKASEDAGKKAADAAGKLVAENQKYLEAVETPYEKLQRQLEELAKTVDANPLIGAETAARTGTQYWQDYLETLKDVTKEVDKFDEFSREAAKNIQDYMGTTLADVLDGNFDDIGASFTKMINRMVAEAAAAQLSRSLFGDLAAGGTGKGLAGDLLGSIGSFLSFDGGGYTGSGSRSGGLDGKGGFMAMMHPQESVLDHTKGQQAGGTTTVIQNFTVGDVASISMVRQAVAGSERRIAASIGRSMTYGGALS